jgi:M6 family metalloprotease-like protein
MGKKISGSIDTMHAHDYLNSKTEHRTVFTDTNGKQYRYVPSEGSYAAVSGKVDIVGNITGETIKGNIIPVDEPSRSRETNLLSSRSSIRENRVAVFLINYLDSGTKPFTKEEAHQKIFNGGFQKFTKEQSFGKEKWSGDVFGWITVQKNSAGTFRGVHGTNEYSCNYARPYKEATEYLVRNNVDLRGYDYVVFMNDCADEGINGAYLSSFFSEERGGTPFQEKEIVVISANDNRYNEPGNRMRSTGELVPLDYSWTFLDFLFAHELGHARKLMHANGLDCGNAQTGYTGFNCKREEYGNSFDVMGSGDGLGFHFTADKKQQMGWINYRDIEFVSSDKNNIQIAPIESDSGVRAVFIVSNNNFNGEHFYTIEYRSGEGNVYDSQMKARSYNPSREGIYILSHYDYDFAVIPRYNRPWGFPIVLSAKIDTNPSSLLWNEDKKDAALKVGQEFYDPVAMLRVKFKGVQDGKAVLDINYTENWYEPYIYTLSSMRDKKRPSITLQAKTQYDIPLRIPESDISCAFVINQKLFAIGDQSQCRGAGLKSISIPTTTLRSLASADGSIKYGYAITIKQQSATEPQKVFNYVGGTKTFNIQEYDAQAPVRSRE